MGVFLPGSTELDIGELIKYYFKARPKFKHIDICSILNQHHHKKKEIATVKNKVKEVSSYEKKKCF